MNKKIACIVAGLVLTFSSSLSFAELRVLIEYDDIEHRLLRLVELDSANTGPVSDHLDSNESTPSNAQVQLRWFDAGGMLVHSSNMLDPRLTHAPLTNSDQAPAVVGLSEGAYMVSGPSESTVLEIRLPAIIALSLDIQVWRIELNR